MKKIVSFVLLLSFIYADGQKNAYPPPDHWVATCMIGGNGNEGMTGDGKEITAAQTTARISARRLPVGVIGINNARAIAGAMALLQSGEIMTWGNGRLGRLGNGNDQSSSSPVKVNGIKN